MSKIEGNAHFLVDFRSGVHAAVFNLFNLGRHLGSAVIYRYLRLRSFASWENASQVFKESLGVWWLREVNLAVTF